MLLQRRLCGRGGLKQPLEGSTKVVRGHKRDPEIYLKLQVRRDTLHGSVSQTNSKQPQTVIPSLYAQILLPDISSLLQANSHSGERLLEGFFSA